MTWQSHSTYPLGLLDTANAGPSNTNVQLLLKLLTLALLALPLQSFACTDIVGWETSLEELPEPSGNKPARPDIKVRRLERGDGATGTKPCGHKVFLELEVFSPIDSEVAGYLFSTPRGSRPYFHVPTPVTTPKQFADGRFGYWFSWLEALPVEGLLPPIDFELQISQVSATGSVGPPVTIRILDSGGLPSDDSFPQSEDP